MIEQIRHEIETIEESANRLKRLAEDNPAIRKNAEILLTFVYLLKFITPDQANAS
jgi:predicted ATPase